MKNPNGYGAVIKLGGKRRKPYAVRLSVGRTAETGSRIYKYLSYHTKRTEAMDALADFHNNPYDLNANNLTLQQIYDKWTEERFIRHGESIPTNYSAAFNYYEDIKAVPFKNIKTATVQEVVDNCSKSFSTQKNIKILFSQLSKYCIANDITQTNYAPYIKLPTFVQSRMHVPFTPEEIALLWTETAHSEVKLALVYIYTGFRPTELLKVTKDNVNLKEKWIRGGMKTEAGKNRLVPIADKILPFVAEMYENPTEHLVALDGQPVLNYDRLLKKLWRKNETLKAHHPHDTRHTCATLMDNAHVELYLQQLILGHSAKSITRKVYTHKTIEQLLEAINKI